MTSTTMTKTTISMGTRFAIRPHVPSGEFWHAKGFALWDEVEDRQVGFYANGNRAEARAIELNAAPSVRKGPPKYVRKTHSICP